MKVYTDEYAEKYFWPNVRKTAECWMWEGVITYQGYGRWRHGSAHRGAYEIAFGEIPEGALITHSCDVKQCVNPAHLSLGTPRSNRNDFFKKGHKHLQNTGRSSESAANQLKDILKSEGMTQKSLAESAQVTSQYVSQTLSGEGSFAAVEKLANSIGYTIQTKSSIEPLPITWGSQGAKLAPKKKGKGK